MINKDESVAILTDLGLTILQAKVYLALLTKDSCTAKTISNISKISRPDVYRIIAQLEGLKLVEKTFGNPAYYQAVPIEMSTSILIHKQTTKLSEIKRKIPIIIQQLNESKANKQDVPKSEFLLINKETFFSRSLNMINNAEKNIHLVVPIDIAIFPIFPFKDAFDIVVSKKIDIRLIMSDTDKETLKKEINKNLAHSNFHVKYIKEKPKTAFGIFDGKEVMIPTRPLDSGNFPAIWSNNENLIDLCEVYFEKLWNGA